MTDPPSAWLRIGLPAAAATAVALTLTLAVVALAPGRVEHAEERVPAESRAAREGAARLLREAALLEADGNVVRARTRLRESVRLSPSSAACRHLGSLCLRMGQFEEADEAFRRSLALVDTDAESWDGLADALLAQERPREAVDAYERALALGVDAADTHAGLGEALARCGDDELSREHRRRASELAPDRYDAVVPGVDPEEVRATVQRLRGLTFERIARVVHQSREAHVESRVKWMRDAAAAHGEALFSSVSSGDQASFDPAAVGRAAGDDTGAFFDPADHRVYVVSERMTTPRILQMLLAHEFMHALQHDRFPRLSRTATLTGWTTDFDRGLAIACLVEGDARFVESAVRDEVFHGTRGLVALGGAFQDHGSPEAIEEMLREHYETAGTDGARSVPVLGLGIEYELGAFMVASVWQRGGWPAVNALYDRPPTSTEQCLHPEKLLGERRDEPSTVATPTWDPPGWSRVSSVTFGQIGVLRSLARYGMSFATARSMAEGWDGDLRVLWRNAAGDIASATTVVFDSQREAEQFFAHFRRETRSVPLSGFRQAPDAYQYGDDGLVTNRASRFVVRIEGLSQTEAMEYLEQNPTDAVFRD